MAQFVNSGVLTGIGSLAGTSSPTFANAGSMIAVAPLSGVSAVTFANESGLLGIGPLSGISLPTFANASVISNAAPTELAGDASLTFELSGTLIDSGVAAISGIAALEFTNSGAASALAQIGGVAPLAFSNESDIGSTVIRQITGTAALVFSLEATQFAEELAPFQTPAGGKGKGKKRRYLVEIDGQEFYVDSVEQAEQLLNKAREIAEQKAPKDLLVYSKKIRRKRVPRPASAADMPLPDIRTPDPEIAALVARTRKAIDEIYLNAARDAELRELIRRKMRDEEREDEELLLLIA